MPRIRLIKIRNRILHILTHFVAHTIAHRGNKSPYTNYKQNDKQHESDKCGQNDELITLETYQDDIDERDYAYHATKRNKKSSA